MGPKGFLKSLDFKKLYISSDSQEPLGGIIGNIEGGTVENCNIDMGVIINNGPAGMIAGQSSQGIIRNCSASGMVVGTSTDGNMESENFALVGSNQNTLFDGNTQSITFSKIDN